MARRRRVHGYSTRAARTISVYRVCRLSNRGMTWRPQSPSGAISCHCHHSCAFYFVKEGGGATHPHSRAGSSRSSIFGKRWSRNALSSAYSLSAVRSGCASKVPIQPRRRVLQVPFPLALYLRVFHVTKSGL